MRQLNQFGAGGDKLSIFPLMLTLGLLGWMHNRCRMIVAMYLTKDLMLDWRLGEKVGIFGNRIRVNWCSRLLQYFMENLIDGDLASNNGGWQWSASTGTDPQPYFRIFNPISQSEKVLLPPMIESNG